jgi:hypothetical protein
MVVGQSRFSLWQLGRSKTSKTHHGLRRSVAQFTFSCAWLRALVRVSRGAVRGLRLQNCNRRESFVRHRFAIGTITDLIFPALGFRGGPGNLVGQKISEGDDEDFILDLGRSKASNEPSAESVGQQRCKRELCFGSWTVKSLKTNRRCSGWSPRTRRILDKYKAAVMHRVAKCAAFVTERVVRRGKRWRRGYSKTRDVKHFSVTR